MIFEVKARYKYDIPEEIYDRLNDIEKEEFESLILDGTIRLLEAEQTMVDENGNVIDETTISEEDIEEVIKDKLEQTKGD